MRPFFDVYLHVNANHDTSLILGRLGIGVTINVPIEPLLPLGQDITHFSHVLCTSVIHVSYWAHVPYESCYSPCLHDHSST